MSSEPVVEWENWDKEAKDMQDEERIKEAERPKKLYFYIYESPSKEGWVEKITVPTTSKEQADEFLNAISKQTQQMFNWPTRNERLCSIPFEYEDDLQAPHI